MKRRPLANITNENTVTHNNNNNMNMNTLKGHNAIDSIVNVQKLSRNAEKDKEMIEDMSRRIRELETDAQNSRDIANALQLKLATQIEEYEELRVAKLHEANLLREAAKLLSAVEADRTLLEVKIKENTTLMTKELSELEQNQPDVSIATPLG